MIALGATTQELGTPADTDAMTAEPGTATATARTWTPRIATQLAVLAAAAFPAIAKVTQATDETGEGVAAVAKETLAFLDRHVR